MTSVENLTNLGTLLENLVKNITQEIQYEDVASCVDEIQILCQEYPTLVPIFDHFMTETYCSKGAMCEVVKKLTELEDQCFQLRLFKLLTENVDSN